MLRILTKYADIYETTVGSLSYKSVKLSSEKMKQAAVANLLPLIEEFIDLNNCFVVVIIGYRVVIIHIK